VQKEILEKNPSSKLRVYVVWFSMVPTDARSRWAWTGGVLSDPRTVNLWDEKKKVGRFFAGKDPDTDDPDVVWDAYYLYGPDAQWDSKPEPMISTGATVRAEADELRNKLIPLL
jgi:hypothetical protein